MRDDDTIDDVVLIMSLFAVRSDFPDTADFLNRLITVNNEFDMGKITVLDDGRIVMVAICPVRILDKEHLVLLLDQVGAGNNAAFDALSKFAK